MADETSELDRLTRYQFEKQKRMITLGTKVERVI